MDTRTSPIRLRISQLQELLAREQVHAGPRWLSTARYWAWRWLAR